MSTHRITRKVSYADGDTGLTTYYGHSAAEAEMLVMDMKDLDEQWREHGGLEFTARYEISEET